MHRLIRAMAFAEEAHRGQTRKYTGDPYIVHPLAVARISSAAGVGEDAVIAALLHDTVEDTAVDLVDVRMAFGDTVAEYVWYLSDASVPEDGNRKMRKAIDRDHIAEAPPVVKSVKLADLIDNSRSIAEFDPGFAKVFMEEKARLLQVLSQGDLELFTMATDIVRSYDADMYYRVMYGG